jgi:hypothetical protein
MGRKAAEKIKEGLEEAVNLGAMTRAQISEYNKDVRSMSALRAEYVRALIEFDNKWRPDVVEKRKAEGFYRIP